MESMIYVSIPHHVPTNKCVEGIEKYLGKVHQSAR